ncbi:hypothetical protein IC614_03145 [Allosphingosinicella flava]|uniref:Uncharacterized protein n=1 Tax=Allosphingosinicella flava TaxID=2771430 RepID=A0A7T2LMT2_9SPHN|nr:hypothetical protein [Sphingosinicella flava]QPQ55613.1 hypothetical protein IC614_03145 [Sphingosinicella flava]
MSTFEWIVCCRCKENFGMDRATYGTLKKSGATFHCPFGHPQHFTAGKTEEQKLREQLEEERRQRQRAEQAVARQADWRREAEERAKHERARANGYKGHATRITKRAKAGVCPCCNRSFQQLARHMAAKHPQFTPLEVEPA